MATTILKGKISAANHVVKYDDEGIEYFLYTITIDKKNTLLKPPEAFTCQVTHPLFVKLKMILL